MKPIIIHNETELELWQAVDYYENKCVGIGLNLEHEVSRSLSGIKETPERLPIKRLPIKRYGTRRRLLQRFPYAIYYLELQDAIWIVALAHTSRKPYYWRNRMEKINKA